MNAARRNSISAVSRPTVVVLAGLLVAAAACLSCLLAAAARGQQGPLIGYEDAPPMRYVPPEERERLASERDLKGRTRLAIELAEARLLRAEQHIAASQYSTATAELGIYQALIQDAMRYIAQNSESKDGKYSDKVRDIYKRVELTLRGHAPRLETIRRNLPSEEAVNARAVYEYTRRAREEALNSFYGASVLREGSAEKEKASESNRPKDTPPNPEEQ